MRTQQEIIGKMAALEKDGDFFGFIRGDLVEALTYENAKSHLKPETTAEQWAEVHAKASTDLAIIEQMRGYMDFAWQKANDCRGLSAGRSMNHYYAWLWLIGQDELAESTTDYNHYGKDQLVRICRFLDLDSAKWDDGRRVNSDAE